MAALLDKHMPPGVVMSNGSRVPGGRPVLANAQVRGLGFPPSCSALPNEYIDLRVCLFSLSVLSVCLTVCLLSCFFVCLPVCLSACLSASLLACLACLSVCLFVCLTVCLSICLSACLYIYIFVSPSVCLPVRLSLCLSASPPPCSLPLSLSISISSFSIFLSLSDCTSCFWARVVMVRCDFGCRLARGVLGAGCSTGQRTHQDKHSHILHPAPAWYPDPTPA